MVSTDALWEALWNNASCIALTLGADTRLSTLQRARMIALASLGSSNSQTSPAEDNEIVYCLRQVMAKANKGRG